MADIQITVLDPSTACQLSGLLDMARDMLGFSEDMEDIYGDAKWVGWLNAARDDLVAEMADTGALVPVTTVSIAATGAAEYDLLSYGFLRIDRVGYAAGSEDIGWLPLYDRDDASPYLSEPTATAGAPGIAYRSGIATVGFADAPASGTVYVQGPRLMDPMAASDDATGLPCLFREAVCLGAALRACRHDIGRTENAVRLPLLDGEWREKLRRLRYVMRKMTPSRAGFVAADGVRPYERYGYGRGWR